MADLTEEQKNHLSLYLTDSIQAAFAYGYEAGWDSALEFTTLIDNGIVTTVTPALVSGFKETRRNSALHSLIRALLNNQGKEEGEPSETGSDASEDSPSPSNGEVNLQDSAPTSLTDLD